VSDLVTAIASIRDGVGVLLRISPAPVAGQFQVAIVGTTWCISVGGAFVTAHHVLNEGNPRDPAHKYYVLRAPGNGHVLRYCKGELEPQLSTVEVQDNEVTGGGLRLCTARPPRTSTPVGGTKRAFKCHNGITTDGV